MNKKNFKLRKSQMEAMRLISQLEEELVTLPKRKTALKGHGSNTAQIAKDIKEKQFKLRAFRKIAKQKTPASAYELPSSHKKKTLIHTRDAQKRPMQGGRASSK